MNPLLSAPENAHLAALRSNGTALLRLVDAIDWDKWFIRAAIALNTLGIVYVTYVYSLYAAYFGYPAIAFIGQYLIGLFFLVAVVSNTGGLHTMLASVGTFILANSF